MTLDDVKAQLARIDHRVDGIVFRWNASYAFEATAHPFYQPSEDRPEGQDPHVPELIGFFVQIEYDEADIDDPHGPMLVQQGRRWFVGAGVSPDEVLQTCLKAALASAEHRCREWFLVEGIHNPNLSIKNRLIAAQTEHSEYPGWREAVERWRPHRDELIVPESAEEREARRSQDPEWPHGGPH